ncbi:uncharacterized protein LOC116614173 [Nematostella vectensis]|uniref:uncharacterized protein LOC116614173 n=1 Tax=Nematostella vectensis TaxID=45351 RepID=UPI00138FC7E6|nr:uncharacterized protein LOC116614173 [Nematostella vectensis]
MDAPVYMNGLNSFNDKKFSLKRVHDKKEELNNQMKQLDALENSLLQQRKDLEYMDETIKGWSTSFDKMPRNNQGVPYVRNVKEICTGINRLLNDIHGDFYFRMQNLVTADVPCFQQVYEGLETLKKHITKILHDENAYKATFIEEIRQLLGKIRGVTATMLEVYFTDK